MIRAALRSGFLRGLIRFFSSLDGRAEAFRLVLNGLFTSICRIGDRCARVAYALFDVVGALFKAIRPLFRLPAKIFDCFRA